jgi:hypothetical protein
VFERFDGATILATFFSALTHSIASVLIYRLCIVINGHYVPRKLLNRAEELISSCETEIRRVRKISNDPKFGAHHIAAFEESVSSLKKRIDMLHNRSLTKTVLSQLLFHEIEKTEQARLQKMMVKIHPLRAHVYLLLQYFHHEHWGSEKGDDDCLAVEIDGDFGNNDGSEKKDGGSSDKDEGLSGKYDRLSDVNE